MGHKLGLHLQLILPISPSNGEGMRSYRTGTGPCVSRACRVDEYNFLQREMCFSSRIESRICGVHLERSDETVKLLNSSRGESIS